VALKVVIDESDPSLLDGTSTIAAVRRV